MRAFALLFFCFICWQAPAQVAPIPESQQAALALHILDEYQGARPAIRPKVLHVLYFTPSDRAPEPRYRERLTAILEDIQSFYRENMERLGFGPMTFDLERDSHHQPVIHLVKGKEPESDYQKPDSEKICRECEPVLEADGTSFDRETVLIFCNLAHWDEKAKTFSHHSPYYGMWNQTNGLCFAVDSAILDLDDLTRTSPMLQDDEYGDMSLGRFNTIFIGGIAHELGHAFGLPHCGEREDEKSLGTSIMGIGNHTYREERRGEGKGSFLTMASAMRLASRPLFSGSDKGAMEKGTMERCDLALSTNVLRRDLLGKPGAIRLEGVVAGSPPIYGVIAYFDSIHDGGYRSPTATSVPDSQGRFAIEISDLEASANGDLRVEFCHANGAISERHLGFSVDVEGRVDLSQWQTRRALEPLAKAVADGQRDAAAEALEKLENGKAPPLANRIGRELALTLDPGPKPKPSDVPMTVSNFALGDAQSESAEVGWLEPAQNRVPLEPGGVDSPLLDSGRLYATGLFAHAPSRYVFNLGGKWKELDGEAGLHTLQQPYGSVVFIIKADGREMFRSPLIKGAEHARYKVDVSGVKTLELIVDDGGDSNHNDWALWLDPTLRR